jgi:hypothetical protein
VARRPGPEFAIPVPEVTIRSLSEPASTEPKASMTRRSASQFAAIGSIKWRISPNY